MDRARTDASFIVVILALVAVLGSCGPQRTAGDGAEEAEAAEGDEMEPPPSGCRPIFDNYNAKAVQNNAFDPPFTVQPRDAGVRLCWVDTYHWNNAKGARPVGTIGLRDAAGKMLGPWQAVGSPGQGGVPNVNWRATPPGRVILPAGPYTVVDSNPQTWSWNAPTRDGFAKVWVEP